MNEDSRKEWVYQKSQKRKKDIALKQECLRRLKAGLAITFPPEHNNVVEGLGALYFSRQWLFDNYTHLALVIKRLEELGVTAIQFPVLTYFYDHREKAKSLGGFWDPYKKVMLMPNRAAVGSYLRWFKEWEKSKRSRLSNG
jgi:hypothetical protein